VTTTAPFEVGEWHGVELTQLTGDMINWLITTYGNDAKKWFLRGNWIYFRDQRDHTMFLLRWQ
jgi:hypothetical protein